MKKYKLAFVFLLLISFVTTSCKKDNPIDTDSSSSSKDTVSNYKLIAYYHFDNMDAKDYSGMNNNASIQNNVTFVNSDIKGKAAHLEGLYGGGSQGGHILLPNLSFNNLNEFTVSMWVKEYSTTIRDGEAYFYCGDHYTGWLGIMNHIIPEIDSSKRVMFASGAYATAYPLHWSNALVLLYPENTWKGIWTHYAISYTNGYITAYRNSLMVGSVFQPIKISNNNTAIGRHWYASETSTRLTADIDEVRVYARALINTEIISL
ncbi:MAG: LamG domain-containing protein, partial [Candidatus Kapabacteria bacterium]|nr:LamG domain-containing protein [Candidatus Kapabacteria bacterium]